MENKNIRFRPNIPEMMIFKFAKPLEKEGQYGKFYSYGVEYKGDDAYMAASPALKEMLDQVPNLEGRCLEIMKYEDGDTRKWIIKDDRGTDLMNPGMPETPAPANAVEEAREYFNRLEAEEGRVECPHCKGRLRILWSFEVSK